MFFLAEYTHVITVSFMLSALFLGGWHFPWIATPDSHYAGAWLVKCLVLWTKVGILIIGVMLIRWTLPRFRFDQLMTLTWQGLVPLAFVNLIILMFVKQFGWPTWILTLSSALLFVGAVAFNGTMLRKRLRSIPAAAALAARTAY